jgi:hypothetical protein
MTPQHQSESHVGARFSASLFAPAPSVGARLYPELRRDAAPLLSTTSTQRAALAIGVSLFVFALAVPSVLGNCKCHRAADNETTHFGGNEAVIFVAQESHQSLAGTVHAPDGTKLGNALIEVFDHPEYLLDDKPGENHPEQKRLAACRTAADGKFCFRNLPPGKYELRSSIGSGWDVTHVYVGVDNNGAAKKIQIRMKLGT